MKYSLAWLYLIKIYFALSEVKNLQINLFKEFINFMFLICFLRDSWVIIQNLCLLRVFLLFYYFIFFFWGSFSNKIYDKNFIFSLQPIPNDSNEFKILKLLSQALIKAYLFLLLESIFLNEFLSFYLNSIFLTIFFKS